MHKINNLPKDDEDCGWFHISNTRKARPQLNNNISAKWVIIGAGFTGLSAARRLAHHYPNDEIVLVEAQEVGFGASGRNSGFVIDLPHDIGAKDYIGDLATARKTLKLQQEAQKIIIDLVEKYQIPCDLDYAGKYQAAIEDKGLKVLNAYRKGLDKLEQDYTIYESDELSNHIGTTFYKKALYTPGTILIQPSAFVKGAADNLPSNVTLYENTAITSVTYGNQIRLDHAMGQITTDKLILTNNAFASEFGYLKRKLLPIFTYASITRPLTIVEQQQLGGKDTWGIIPADPFGTTLRKTKDNRLLIRNSMSYNPKGICYESQLKKSFERHVNSFKNRFPMLPNVRFDHTWGGAMCLSRNHMSFFGELQKNVYGSLCCNGLGSARGTMGGHLLADWLAGDKNELTDFLLTSEKPCSNPPEPFLSLGINLSLKVGQYKAGLEC